MYIYISSILYCVHKTAGASCGRRRSIEKIEALCSWRQHESELVTGTTCWWFYRLWGSDNATCIWARLYDQIRHGRGAIDEEDEEDEGEEEETFGMGLLSALFITDHISHNMLIISFTVYRYSLTRCCCFCHCCFSSASSSHQPS